MIPLGNSTLPTIPNTVSQPHPRRQGGGGQPGQRWNDILRNGTATPPEEETVEEPAAPPRAAVSMIDILA